MQEVFEKIIERLQSEVERWEDSGKQYNDKCEIAVARGIRNAIEIVKQTSEEYNSDQINQLAMMYAKNLVQYGVDITQKWDTATQQEAVLNQAYIRGRKYERDSLAEEFNSRSKKNEKRTNADRIRSMSDEELADIILCPYDTEGNPIEIMLQKLVSPDNCKKCMIEWLQSKEEG